MVKRRRRNTKEYRRGRNSTKPIGTYIDVCDVPHYPINNKRNRTEKVKTPPHPLLSPTKAGRNEDEEEDDDDYDEDEDKKGWGA